MTDFFERLGLPRRFAIDGDTLEREYLLRSRAVHPDYHSSGSSADLAASMDAAAALNEAYITLREPFPRAEYLLSLWGGPSAAEHKAMPPTFLAEMLEAREAVENACGNPAAVAALDQEFRQRLESLMGEAAQHLLALEAAPDSVREGTLTEIRGFLNAARFVRGLLRDLHTDDAG